MLRTLLVPLDGSPLAEHVLPTAAALARQSGATLDIVRVHRPLAVGDLADLERWERSARRDEREYLQLTADAVTRSFGVRATTALLDEPVATAICRRASEVGAELIAMATHGRTGFSRAWLGSIADAVMRHATLPVLLFRADPELAARREGTRPAGAWVSDAPLRIHRVLVPLDGSGLAEQVIGPAIELARNTGASIHLVRVVEPVLVRAIEYPLFYALPLPAVDEDGNAAAMAEAREYMAGIVARIRSAAPLDVETEVVAAQHAAPAVIEAVRRSRADVVALATHGRGASRLVAGSVADKVLRSGPAAVLYFRPVQD